MFVWGSKNHPIRHTPGTINMELENTSLEKEHHLPNHHFLIVCYSSGVYIKSHFLVGGFNPSEKYARQNGNLAQIGVKIKNMWNLHHHPESHFSFSFPIFCWPSICPFGEVHIWVSKSSPTPSGSSWCGRPVPSRPVVVALKPPQTSWEISGQISIIPKPELRGFGGDSLTKPQFKVTSAEVVIICPEIYTPWN